MTEVDTTVVRHRSGVLVSTLPQAFQQTAALQPDAVAIRTVGDKVVITWRQYADRVRNIAAGLSALGVERGHTVGLMLRNRPEFHLTDTAVMHLGAIPFSIYNTSAPDQIRYLFSNAENKIVFTEKDFLPAVKAAGADLAQVIVVDADADGCLTLEHLESLGAESRFRFRFGVASGTARRYRDAHLHLGNHRPAQGRRAYARECDGRVLGNRRAPWHASQPTGSPHTCRTRTSPTGCPGTTPTWSWGCR